MKGKFMRRGNLFCIVCMIFVFSLSINNWIGLNNTKSISTENFELENDFYPTKSDHLNTIQTTLNDNTDQYSMFKGEAYSTNDLFCSLSDGTWQDSSLKNYLALEQIFSETINDPDNYQVVIFDQLVDFTHPDLKDVISKVVLIPNDNNIAIREFSKSQLVEKDPYIHFPEYIETNCKS